MSTFEGIITGVKIAKKFTAVNFLAILVISAHGNLVSDDDTISNHGITLPEGEGATHNMGLAPLFFMRGGRGSNTYNENVTMWRGDDNFLWSKNAARGYEGRLNWSYYMVFNVDTTHPTDSTSNAHSYSLRCLVSTN